MATYSPQILREAVRHGLDKCDEFLTPSLHERMQSLEGYRQVEQMVIDYVIANDVSVETAISFIEVEL